MTAPVAKTPDVFLVVVDDVGLYGAYLNRMRAHEIAEAVEGVLLRLPSIADYRSKESTP